MSPTSPRIRELEELLAARILVGDGAMGTMIQAAGLQASDFGEPHREGCNEILVRTRPDVIRAIHEAYLEAGADFVETDTFGATPLVLAEYGLAGEAEALNRAAALLAREAADRFATAARPRFVAGSVGPTTRAISVTGGVTFDELIEHFAVQARGLIDGGVDWVLCETCQDTRNVKAAVLGIRRAARELGRDVPIMISGTIEMSGTMLAGQTAEAFAAALLHLDLLALGLNCATGPDLMRDHLRSLAELSAHRTSCLPNAGLPDEDGRYGETPQSLASALARFAERGWLNIAGGCCGTRPDHIRALAAALAPYPPRRPPIRRRVLFSGVELTESSEETRPLIVGERTNVIGSRRFRRLIAEQDYEGAAEIARQQVRAGAHILDVCVQDPDRDEMADMERFLAVLIRKVRVPLMIDSTDATVIARALTYCQGRAILNSINLETGEDRFAAVVPLARTFGAAVIVGAIDEDPIQGMAVSRGRKLAIARRAYSLLTGPYGLNPEDIIWDPLVFPCGTGDRNYAGSAEETIEGLRLLKQEFPRTRTILGISNVSFGLPPAGREVLNSVFLHHCTLAGLDLAIVNAEKLERYPSIPAAERELAENLLFDRGADPVAAFAAHFRDASSRLAVPAVDLPLDRRLARYIIEGSREGLVDDLERKLREADPLAIINGPLMEGMAEVGRLFAANELIVAEVLQSAEAMKVAVAHLEQSMERHETARRGTVVLATVKGDVHDIGKNLVHIILANNGYRVIDLGIKVGPERLIAAAREHRPDAVGLSGLLVKSAQQMVSTAEDLRESGIDVPLLVGGAALSRKFTRTRIAPAYGGLVAYAEDAMSGLDLLGRILDPARRRELEAELSTAAAAAAPGPVPTARPPPAEASQERSRAVSLTVPLPAPPDFERHVEVVTRLEDIWSFVNPQMLYVRHLGLRGRFDSLLAAGDPKAAELYQLVERVKQWWHEQGLQARAVWRFFAATSRGNEIALFDQPGSGAPLARFRFPRQPVPDGLCLSDLVLPAENGRPDAVALFVTTVGDRVRERAEALRESGEYVFSHALQALALETAEAAAEWLHCRLRAAWGFPDPPALSRRDLFRACYRGKRYSFGYPACPDLEPQSILFELLEPGQIGVELTEGFMMDPEASVSALVFHHPDASYFSVGPGSE